MAKRSKLHVEHLPLPEYDGDDLVADDLRVLTCRLCGQSFHQTRFHVVAQHLRRNHHKFETSRRYSLEDFVEFGCARGCHVSVKFNTVRQWSKHFSADCTDCEGPVAVQNVAASQKLEDEENAPALQPVVELEQPQSQEVDDNPALDTAFKAPSAEAQMDLRRLTCHVCNYRADKCRVFVMFKHIRDEHHVTSSEEAEQLFSYGCSNCPNFRPNNVLQWENHFDPKCLSKCSGGSAAGAGRENWCDTCCESYTDIKTHFSSDAHTKNVETYVQKNCASIPLTCQTCSVKFTTQPNLNLHMYLTHKTSL